MRLLRGLHNPGIDKVGCVATIGNFDGVHLGHQAIIHQVVTRAKTMGIPSVVIIFEPQPMEFFRGAEAPARLMRFREKFQVLSALGLDFVFCLKFDARLSKHTADEFIAQILVSHLNIRHLVIGDDFHFGSDRRGDFNLLNTSGKSKGFTVERMPTTLDFLGEKGTRVSSTHLRELLSSSCFADAEQLLSRPYQISGRVIQGEKMGRQLGFPTANIALYRDKALFTGVYAVGLARKSGGKLNGVANIGTKPTVGNFRPSLEVHLFDFDTDIYGEYVSVHFIEKIREEKHFEDLLALKNQISSDIKVAKGLIEIKA